ncbi:MAG: glutamine--fructose-6-phosphate transaminase (isomerizing) [Candidatus Symbiodolus clandestinus]
MCGIIAAIAQQRNVSDALLAGLARLEYRGYDSAGIAVADSSGELQRIRRVGKVQQLIDVVEQLTLSGTCGIAHTRWATHGALTESNAHPHLSGTVAIVHNGIIENYRSLRQCLQQQGYHPTSETDSEIIAHLLHWEQSQLAHTNGNVQPKNPLRLAVQQAIPQLQGSYGLVAMDSRFPNYLIAVRCGSPLIIGLGKDAYFVASDQYALPPDVNQVVFLQEGDLAEISAQHFKLWNSQGEPVVRSAVAMLREIHSDKGNYQHYMQKEIHEQPLAISHTLTGRLLADRVNLSELGPAAIQCLEQVEHLHIVACGTAYHAGLVARYWFEALAKIPCEVEIASEFRYRKPVTRRRSLLLVLSQSGETADTLAALRLAQGMDYLGTLAICNNPGSTLVRESDWALITHAGREIGVASTKAFTTQLVLLLLLVVHMARHRSISAQQEQAWVQALTKLPENLQQLLSIEVKVAQLAAQLVTDRHILFIGRGVQYPIAMEGALKLKELAYIPAEAFAAGELKHGPLALIDSHIPVIVLAPQDELAEKLQSNLEEIAARGGRIYWLADSALTWQGSGVMTRLKMPSIVSPLLAPIAYVIPLQFLAYHIALLKGHDIDQPRNLAKSVTVE